MDIIMTSFTTASPNYFHESQSPIGLLPTPLLTRPISYFLMLLGVLRY